MGSDSALAIVVHDEPNGHALEKVLSIATELQTPVYHAVGDGWIAISVGDGSGAIEPARFEALEGVERVLRVAAPYRLASKELFDDRPIRLRSNGHGRIVEVGGGAPLMIAVAAVSNEGARPSPDEMVDAVLSAGGTVLAAGEFSSVFAEGGTIVSKPQLVAIEAAARKADLLVSVEVADAQDVAAAAEHADVLQVGHRSMQDFSLLRELGRSDRPVILKRGLGATIEEFLLAAEYVLANGNGRVILCESGIRAHGSGWKPRFEINAIPLLKQATHLPVVADPSHSSAHPQLIPAVARAAIAAGADGLVVEVETSGHQVTEGAMDIDTSREAVEGLRPVAAVMGRSLNANTTDRVRRSANGSGIAAAGAQNPFAGVSDVLHDTNGTLALVIERALGEAPRLEVMKQKRISAPYPTWLRWLLRPDGDLLVRWTRYVIGSTTLSRNLSFVDFGRVDPEIMSKLEAEELNLGQLFTNVEIDKFGFEFGSGVNSGEFDMLLREGHSDTKSLHPYVWRRYIAATSGRVGFLVFEALPSVAWRNVLDSQSSGATGAG
jgi:3-deoxy-7-phosphoheptulonate synthase